MIPVGWQKTTIVQIASLVTSGSRGWAEYYRDDGDYFIRITNLRRSSIRPDFSKMKYVRLPVSGNEGQRTRLKKNDILISITADLGTIGFLDKELDRPSYINQHIALVRLVHLKANPKFVAYQLASKGYHEKFQKLNDAGAIPWLNLTTIKSMTISLPPYAEQLRIAEILSTWDRAIEATEKLIANSEAQKKALMQQLLTGKKRLPGFHGEWSAHRLDSLAIVKMGSSPKSETYNETGDGLPLLQGNADIKNGRSFPRLFTNDPTQRCAVSDILLSVRAPVGSIAVSDHEACIGRGLAAITPRSDSTYNFLLEFLKQQEPKWQSLSQGSTFEAVNSKDIKSLLIPAPPSAKEFEALGKLFATLSLQLSSLNKLLDRLVLEKSALMQQLLTGKRRVAINKEEAVA